MLRQLRFELFKMSKRPRSYMGFAAFLVINALVVIGLVYGGAMEMNASRQGFEMVGSPLNAEFVAWTVVASPFSNPIMVMFMPFFVCLIFGEIISGEASEGTLRTVLTRPISRASLFLSKFTAGTLYALALVLFLGVSAYLLGLVSFGRGGLLATGTFMSPMLSWFNESEGLVRLLLGYVLAFAALMPVGMIAFFVSSWTSNSLGAMGAAIMLLFVSLILGSIPYFEPIKGHLFSTYLMNGQNAFLDPVPWGEVRTALVCQGVYVVVLLVASLLIFRRKDILA